MIEAGHLHARTVPRQAERQHGGVEQRHVAGVRHDARMEGGIVGQVAVGAHPHALAVGRVVLTVERIVVDVADVDGPGSVEPDAHPLLVGRHPSLEIGKRFGRWHVGRHRELMVRAGLVHVKAGLQVEDGLAVLNGNDPRAW